VCGGSFVAIWRLHGDSKFGEQPQEEINELRGRILRKISFSLIEIFEPILTRDTSTAVSQIIIPNAASNAPEPKITVKGQETLLNAVRDFVKSDITAMKSLRSLDASDACITHSLIWLRRLSRVLVPTSGAFLALALLSKYGVWPSLPVWPHIAGLAISAIVLCISFAFIWRISHAVNVFKDLKGKHNDFS
jgi:hypothetical protein